MDTPLLASFDRRIERGPNAALEVRDWLRSLPLDLTHDVVLLTHELTVNALTHTSTRHVWLSLLVCPEVVHVQVANEGDEPPRLAHPERYAESGRGLRWVDALSEEWGVDCTSATYVWFQVPLRKRRDRRGVPLKTPAEPVPGNPPAPAFS